MFLVAAGASFAFPGCGFLGAAPFPEQPQPDVAPWQDDGPVTFCDGALRISAPSDTTAGFCDARAALVTCARDADCASRERCTCGGCQVAYCTSGTDCRGGDVCSFSDFRCDHPCATTADCASGETCLPGQGVCRGACHSDGDCQRGESCQQAACVTTPCAGDGDCDGAAACRLARTPATLREPMPLANGTGVTLYVERSDGNDGTASIWRATSSDGRRFTFTPDAAVLTPGAGDGDRLGAPALLALPSGGFLAALADGNGRLRRATSSDGITFSLDAAPLLTPAHPWEQSGLDAPTLAPNPEPSAGGPLLLYYGLADRTAIGLARGDGTTFTQLQSPVLIPAAVADPTLWRDVDRIASPFAQTLATPEGGVAIRLLFAARGLESATSTEAGTLLTEAPNFSIGEASATGDGSTLVPWPFDPVFDRVEGFLSHDTELDPAVLLVGARQFLYYRGAQPDESLPTNIGAAENPITASIN